MVCFRDKDRLFQFPDANLNTISFRDLLETDVDKSYYFKDDHKYMPILKKDMVNLDSVYQWRRTYVRENKKGVCPTLTANMGSGGHNVPLVIDGGFRKLTPRECARFQGFPDTFSLPAIANCHLYKQFGNSVTVPLVKRLAESIKQVI
jgi:DNA (cytosine-5)-methyltransferase 1